MFSNHFYNQPKVFDRHKLLIYGFVIVGAELNSAVITCFPLFVSLKKAVPCLIMATDTSPIPLISKVNHRNCSKCKIEVPVNELVPVCSLCDIVSHFECIKISRSNWRKRGTRQKNFRCKSCRSILAALKKSQNIQSYTTISQDGSVGQITQEMLSAIRDGNADAGIVGNVDSGSSDFDDEDDFSDADDAISEMGTSPLPASVTAPGTKSSLTRPAPDDIQGMLNYLISKQEEDALRIRSLETSLNRLHKQLDTQREQLSTQQKMCKKLLDDNERYRKDNTTLRSDLRRLDQRGRLRNLVIHNTPPVKNMDDALDTVVKLAVATKSPVTRNDLDIAHILPSRAGPPKLIVRFTCEWKKISFQRNLKAAKLTGANFGWPGAREIFSTNHLTKDTSDLLQYTKEKLSSNNGGQYRFVWVRSGVVFVRRNENARATAIHSPDDVDELTRSK